MRDTSNRILARIAAGWLLFAAAILCASLAIAAAPASDETPLAIVTIIDGKAQLMRGEERLQLVEGSRLLTQDVIETDSGSRLVRIEFSDGLAFNLGPSTRVLIDPQFYGERGRFARLYLLSGWVKLKSGPAAAPDKPGTAAKAIPLLASPAIDIFSATGNVVTNVEDSAVWLFVESGSAQIQERLDAKPAAAPAALRSGQFLARAAKAKSAVSARPAAAFIDKMPRSFLDTLPDRAAMFKDRQPKAKAIGEISYEDAKDWLSVEWTLRRPAMRRWQDLTRDPEFRKALTANMSAHPEWDRVLFPEKYRSRK